MNRQALKIGLCGLILAVSLPAMAQTSTFTDSRNEKQYRTVKIGKFTWMAENLNFNTGKSWCNGNSDANCQKYGRLYDWNTAKSACPAGWRLPGNAEWNDLSKSAGGQRMEDEYEENVFYWYPAGKKLKLKTGWDNNGNGTDGLGFSAMPGGCRYAQEGFSRVGWDGWWWSATEYDSGNAWTRDMNSTNDHVRELSSEKVNGFSVRCVQ